MAIRRINCYGWRVDLPDFRDKLYSTEIPDEVQPLDQLPSQVDLRAKMPPVYDQGAAGSCTAQSIAANVQYIHPGLMPSRLFIYYNERVLEGSQKEDAGAQIRDGMKTIAKEGVCEEVLWPYDVKKVTRRPSMKCYRQAKKDVVSQYLRVSGIQEMKSCLAAGFPFVFGFTVYQSFESPQVAKTGIMHLPTVSDYPVGGHAVMAVGYDDEKKVFIIRNSWGDQWGLKGYFLMPYEYITDPNLARDMWTVRKIANHQDIIK